MTATRRSLAGAALAARRQVAGSPVQTDCFSARRGPLITAAPRRSGHPTDHNGSASRLGPAGRAAERARCSGDECHLLCDRSWRHVVRQCDCASNDTSSNASTLDNVADSTVLYICQSLFTWPLQLTLSCSHAPPLPVVNPPSPSMLVITTTISISAELSRVCYCCTRRQPMRYLNGRFFSDRKLLLHK